MNADIKLAKNVVLLDVSFLNDTVQSVRQVLVEHLGKPLSPFDLVKWITCLALDSGIEGTGNELQVILVHPSGQEHLTACVPATLRELDGKACNTPWGELTFAAVCAEGLACSEDFYVDLATIVLNSADVCRLLMIPSAVIDKDHLSAMLQQALKETDEAIRLKKMIGFGLESASGSDAVKWLSAVPSLAYTWGLNADSMAE